MDNTFNVSDNDTNNVSGSDSEEFLAQMNYDFKVFLSKMRQVLPSLSKDQAKYIPQWLMRIRPVATREDAMLRQVFVTKLKEGVTNNKFHPIFLKAPPVGPLNALKHYFNIDEAIGRHWGGEETTETPVTPHSVKTPPKGVSFITSSMIPQSGAFLHLSIMTKNH